MTVELIIAGVTLLAVLLLAVHAWWTTPSLQYVPEFVEVGHVAVAPPPPKRRDVLDDYAAELNVDAITSQGSAEHRLALLEALLQEADHETLRLELLVDRLGQQLAPAT